MGVTRTEHLTDALAAVDFTSSPASLARLEGHYAPHVPEGYEANGRVHLTRAAGRSFALRNR